MQLQLLHVVFFCISALPWISSYIPFCAYIVLNCNLAYWTSSSANRLLMAERLEGSNVHVVSPAKDFRLFPLISEVILAIYTKMGKWNLEMWWKLSAGFFSSPIESFRSDLLLGWRVWHFPFYYIYCSTTFYRATNYSQIWSNSLFDCIWLFVF